MSPSPLDKVEVNEFFNQTKFDNFKKEVDSIIIKFIGKNKWKAVKKIPFRKAINQAKNEQELRELIDKYAKMENLDKKAFPTYADVKANVEALHFQETNEDTSYGSVSLQNLLRAPVEKENPIVKRFFPEKSTILIFSEPGKCKSLFSNYLGCCVATGSKFLGQYPVKKSSVLFLSTENSERLDTKRFRAILKGMHISPLRRKPKNILFSYCSRSQVGLLDNELYFESLKDKIKTNNVKLLIIDTISPMVYQMDDNRANEVVEIFKERLETLVDEFGLTLVFLIHSQKTGKDFLGSIKWKASVDVHYELQQDEDNNNLLSLLCHKHREGEVNLKMQIDFIKKGESLDKISFSFLEEFEGKQSVKNKDNNPAKLEQCKVFIWNLLQEKEPQYNEMMSECIKEGFSSSTSKRAIKFLYESNKITKLKGKDRGYAIK